MILQKFLGNSSKKVTTVGESGEIPYFCYLGYRRWHVLTISGGLSRGMRAVEGRRPCATTFSPSEPHISFFLFRQLWATTIYPSRPPHLTLPGKTAFLHGIIKALKVWFSKSSRVTKKKYKFKSLYLSVNKDSSECKLQNFFSQI